MSCLESCWRLKHDTAGETKMKIKEFYSFDEGIKSQLLHFSNQIYEMIEINLKSEIWAL